MDRDLEIPPVLELVVELGLMRMRVAVGETREEAYRPRMCLCVDQRSGMILHFEMGEPIPDYLPLALQCIGKAAEQVGGLPRQVQTRDPKLAGDLRAKLDRFGVEVVVRESLPMLDEAFQSLGEFEGLGVKREPALVDQPGVTLDRLIAFAEAGKLFYQARPWRHLIDDDLIEIEAPPGPKGTRFTQVLGAGGETFGLGFVASLQAHEDLRRGMGLPRGGLWSVIFGDLDALPYDDGEVWQQHNLPVAGPEAYPEFVRTSKSRLRVFPTADELAWAEGLLRALADTSEAELDRGRWEKQVQTSAGPMTFRLSMPLLLEQMAGKASGADPAKTIYNTRLQMEPMLRAIGGPPDSPAESQRAQALCYQAYDARGLRQVQLARQALAIDPNCCEALLILAERAGGDAREALPLLQEAVKAGERQLGPDTFERGAGHFWGLIETRPYMRARQELARTLMDIEEYAQAADHLRDMLRLNPGDNQGNRYLLAQCLLHANRLDELDALLNDPQYTDSHSAEWTFTRALLAYRRDGDSPEARQRLAEAIRCNAFVTPLLGGQVPMPPFSPQSYSPGGADEAVLCVEQIAPGWFDTPGAVEWLVATQPQPGRKTTTRGKRRKRGGS
jgi:tetratricopeptide (TPR) repeat protein